MADNAILCFYHAPCNDGAGAAAALELRLRAAEPDALIEFVPMGFTLQWDDPFDDDFLEQIPTHRIPVSRIYVVDISMSPAKYDQLLEYLREHRRLGDAAPRTICIDHHRTALDSREALDSYCDETLIEIGPGLSGATLVWRYFNATYGENPPIPLLLRYIADQDIWEWKMEDSKAVNSALNTLDGRAESLIDELRWSLEDEEGWLATRRSQGQAIVSVIDSQIQKAYSRVIDIEGTDRVEFRIVNATENSSELGNTLCNESDHAPNVIAWIYSIQRDWGVKCSLRSIPGGRIDARQIAERFGGGGHDHAAGCRFASAEEMRKAIDQFKIQK